jgi:hypothetical protein
MGQLHHSADNVHYVKYALPLLTESLTGVRSGKALDDLDDLVAAEAVVACEFEEIPGPAEHGTALRRAGYGDAAAAPELQQAFVPEHVQRAENGVLVHP